MPGADGGSTLEIAGVALIDGLSIVAPDGGVGVRVDATGAAELRGVEVSGNGQSLIFVAEGELTLSGGQLTGGAYGLLTQQARALRVRNVRVSGQTRAGLAIVNGPVEISDVEVSGPFGEAAISVIHGKLTLTRARIAKSGAVGVKVVNGEAILDGNSIAGGRTDARGLEGNGLYVYNATATLDGDHFADCQGAEISLIGSTATLIRVVLEGASEAAVYVSGSQLTARDCQVRDTPAGLLIEPGSKADGAGFRFHRVTNPVVQLPP
jgi:Right handed beta helix region